MTSCVFPGTETGIKTSIVQSRDTESSITTSDSTNKVRNSLVQRSKQFSIWISNFIAASISHTSTENNPQKEYILIMT